MREFKIMNSKNIPLNVIEGAELTNPDAIIINVHGITSHFQMVIDSEDTIEYRDMLFYSNNIKSYALEFHGHGKSHGIKCSIDDFDDLVDDLYTIVKHIKNKYENSEK